MWKVIGGPFIRYFIDEIIFLIFLIFLELFKHSNFSVFPILTLQFFIIFQVLYILNF